MHVSKVDVRLGSCKNRRKIRPCTILVIKWTVCLFARFLKHSGAFPERWVSYQNNVHGRVMLHPCWKIIQNLCDHTGITRRLIFLKPGDWLAFTDVAIYNSLFWMIVKLSYQQSQVSAPVSFVPSSLVRTGCTCSTGTKTSPGYNGFDKHTPLWGFKPWSMFALFSQTERWCRPTCGKFAAHNCNV